MSWEYSQQTGVLTHNGQFFAQGYSGAGTGENNPAMERVRNTGPIPKGHYRITGAHDTITRVTVVLQPILGTDTFGRDNFRIHGGRRSGEHTASQGCIIIDGVALRQQIVNSGDSILVVR
ncbi:uncharacterized protein DUF2778 [Enterobacter sp. BIGb0383]|uniref:tlde1 domain-containing protein n=1 Tax=unclassified Enterobacter TaxID=2608935 RepID=UPI000F4A0092|nr:MULTISPECIES: tlde1 domain-containing protein [unclassified Enterobacter]ROP60001.1 uncharacterized protein DUF2778 [Enterobacter sp. BIGb0383]ROS08530.1 uncharacterized protein DUF2778 [Enterobacter sp. BIGb0359]